MTETEVRTAIITVVLLLAVDIAIWHLTSAPDRVAFVHIPDDCPECTRKRKEI